MGSKAVTGQLKQLKVGDELICETEKELLVGKLHHIDVNFKFFYLSCVRDLKHNVSLTNNQLLLLERVKCIRIVKPDETSYSSATDFAEAKSSQSLSEESNTSSFISASNQNNVRNNNKTLLPKIELTSFELQQLQNQINSVKVLTFRGQEYNDAIVDIKSRSFIALHLEPYRSGRIRKTALITIATETAVYFFDILSLGKVFEELKSILRAERPCKTMFDSRLVVDHFQHQQNVHLNGISDIFVAYCMITKQKKNLELEDVISQYFGISKDFFTQHVSNDSHILFSRPLQESFITNCAKKVAFMYKLEEYLHKEMLKKYYSQCKIFSRTYADIDDSSEVANSIEIKDNSGHQYIEELDLNDQSL